MPLYVVLSAFEVSGYHVLAILCYYEYSSSSSRATTLTELAEVHFICITCNFLGSTVYNCSGTTCSYKVSHCTFNAVL